MEGEKVYLLTNGWTLHTTQTTRDEWKLFQERYGNRHVPWKAYLDMHDFRQAAMERIKLYVKDDTLHLSHLRWFLRNIYCDSFARQQIMPKPFIFSKQLIQTLQDLF